MTQKSVYAYALCYVVYYYYYYASAPSSTTIEAVSHGPAEHSVAKRGSIGPVIMDLPKALQI